MPDGGKNWGRDKQAPEGPRSGWWMRLPIALRVVIVGVVGLIVLGAIFGSSDSDDRSSGNSGEAKPAADKAPPKPKEIADRTMDAVTTTKDAVRITARVNPPDATVRLRGKRLTPSAAGRVSKVVKLRGGDNTFTFEVSKPGYEDDSAFVVVTRNLTAAEKATIAAKRRLQKEQAVANFKASAQQLDPRLLQKDPDRYAGDKIKISGQIFQIQEGGENFLLMNTQCSTEYDITNCGGPTVYVGYPFSTDKKEDDLITVYGTVVGGKEYDTAAGGSNFVAEVKGKFIE